MATKNKQTNQMGQQPEPMPQMQQPVPQMDQQMMQVQQVVPAQQVQYVVMQQSLKGVGGWLIFWLICFGIAAIGYIWAFFASMLNLSSALSVVTLIFAPILAVGYIASIVLISMQKRLGKFITWATLAVSAVSSVVTTIVGYVTASNAARSYMYYRSYDYPYPPATSMVEKALPMVIAAILVAVVVHVLIALYFFLSKRVKETLVN